MPNTGLYSCAVCCTVYDKIQFHKGDSHFCSVKCLKQHTEKEQAKAAAEEQANQAQVHRWVNHDCGGSGCGF